MKPEKKFVPKAQREVWEWKKSISTDVKNLPIDQALREILKTASNTARQLGLRPTTSALAETPAAYGKKKGK